MASLSSTLLIKCRVALALNQQQFGDILGRSKRTVQRWEERGTTLLPSELEILVRAVHPVRSDLALQMARAGKITLDSLGIPSAAASRPVPALDPIDAVVGAAADAMEVTHEAIRPAIAAAFAKAHEVGLDVPAVVERLSRPAKG